MTLLTKCPNCRRKVLFIKKWSYIVPAISPNPITSHTECCYRCFTDVKFITLGQWSYRHYIKHGIMKLRNYYDTQRNTQTSEPHLPPPQAL